MADLTEDLWRRYRAGGDPRARAQLLDGYLGLVHYAARDLENRVPPDVEYEDLLGAGTLGLVQALEGFDPARGLAFSTFAVPRIRGAMLDELRRREWRPRSARERARTVTETKAALERRLARPPNEHELAAELGVTLRRLRRWTAHLEDPAFVPLDRPIAAAGAPLHEILADETARDPAEALGEAQHLETLMEALDALPERERLVLILSYYEELTLKEIGEVLHVTESRVSQIRTRALARLREQVDCEEAA